MPGTFTHSMAGNAQRCLSLQQQWELSVRGLSAVLILCNTQQSRLLLVLCDLTPSLQRKVVFHPAGAARARALPSAAAGGGAGSGPAAAWGC